MSINRIQITDISSPLYTEFATLYSKSFPIFEQRTLEQQIAAFSSPNYHLDLFYDDDLFVGFFSYWKFEKYSYLEHFAVNDNHRGKGYGAILLQKLEDYLSHTVILEIDPIVDDISAARWRFYERCGFCRNSFKHIHPPYRDGYKGHSLIVLSSKEPLKNEAYDLFWKELNEVVMSLPTHN